MTLHFYFLFNKEHQILPGPYVSTVCTHETFVGPEG